MKYLLFIFLLIFPLAVQADEDRARSLFLQIRCVVCDGQTISDSDAHIAVTMRALVREQIAQGKSDREILDWLVERYGDDVLTTPPLRPATFLLWFSPFLILVAGGFLVFSVIRKGTVP